MSSVTVRRLVDWQDTDAAGHYHHSAVIRWVEAAEAALLDRVDLTRLFGHIPRVRYEVDYLDRLWFGDTASIELSIGKVGRSSIRYDFVVSRIPARAAVPASDSWTVAVRGALIATYAPSAENGSRPWPDAIAAALRGQPTHLPPTLIREV